MHGSEMNPAVEVFSTCPPSHGAAPSDYLGTVREVALWSERAGCRGILVYTDNSLLDPWLLSQVVIEATTTLAPLVAVQPVYMHPYAAAKMVSSLGFLYGRRLYLNMVAGGFTNDLAALRDPTPHDRRYARLVEYSTILRRLLEDESPLTHAGEFYSVSNLRLSPPLARELFPGFVISGSSEAGQAAAGEIGATCIHYPKPSGTYRAGSAGGRGAGIRVGIICRDRGEDAWAIARERFPVERKGQLAHQLAMKVSDSVWHRQLSEMGAADDQGPYWLVPFQNYKTFCPYLVGSYDVVAGELGAYIAAGYTTFILDVPRDPEDLSHIGAAFSRALETSSCPSSSRNG
jgi:alkanesulfonate monooxygenase